jgi:hypothetical protein
MFFHVVPISTLGYFLNPTATVNRSQYFLPTKGRDKLHHSSGIQANRRKCCQNYPHKTIYKLLMYKRNLSEFVMPNFESTSSISYESEFSLCI